MRKFFGVFTLLVFLSMAGLAFEGWRDIGPALAGDYWPEGVSGDGGTHDGTQTVAVSESSGVLESAQAVCVTPARYTKQLFALFPHAVLVSAISVPAVVQTIIKAFNALPPVTDILADLVMVFENPPKQAYRVMFFSEGCQVSGTHWPIDSFQRILSGVGQAV